MTTPENFTMAVNGITPSLRKRLKNRVAATIRERPNSNRDPCLAKKYVLHRHQLEVFETAKVIAAASRSHPDTHTVRGQLIWANTGVGKTVMALSILLAYWPTNRNMFVVTTLANEKTNSPAKYIENLKMYFPQVHSALLDSYGGTLAHTFVKHHAGFNAKVVFITIEKFKNMLVGIAGNGRQPLYMTRKNPENHPFWGQKGSVIIMDEAHRLFEPNVHGSAAENQRLLEVGELLRKLGPGMLPRVHIYPLTATPASDISKWVGMIDLVRQVNAQPVSDSTRLRLKNANASTNTVAQFITTHVAPSVIVVEGRKDLRTHACIKELRMLSTMNRWYYAAYLHKLHELSRSNSASIRKDGALTAGMFLKEGEVSKILPKEVMNVFRANRHILNGKMVSNKFVYLVRYLMSEGGKHFVYTSQKDTALLLASALTKWYNALDVTQVAIDGHENRRGSKFRTSNSNRVNFVVWGDKNEKMLTHASRTSKELLSDAFNSEDNGIGAHIKIFIATGSEYEGTDLMALQHVHLAEPMLNPLKERQAVGRGVRFCAHVGLHSSEKKVTVVRWFLEPPSRSARDNMLSYMSNLHRNKMPHVATTLRSMNAAANHEDKGYEYNAWYKSMRTPEAVRLFNFERMIALASRGLPPISNATAFHAAAGKPCP
jgi:hypothetical protein